MKLKLPDNIYSPQDLNQLILQVESYARWQTQAAVKKQAGTKPPKTPALTKEARAVLRSWHGQKSPTSKTVDKLLTALKMAKDTAPTITVTLAGPAGPKLKAHITNWCRKNLSDDVLIDFGFDSDLLGGMVVRWGSHIYDWSFRRRIMAERHRFPEVLRHV